MRFSDVVMELLKGSFICGVTQPDMFSFLRDDSNRERVDLHLAAIGLQLNTTQNNCAYYNVYRSDSYIDRHSVYNLFREIKQDVAPVLQFLDLIQHTKRTDTHLVDGDVIDFPSTLAQIKENPYLEEMLTSFISMGKEFTASDASLHSMLDRLLAQMTKRGYLVKEQQGNRYRVTGKIDFYYEAFEFIIENSPTIQNAEDMDINGKQGALL